MRSEGENGIMSKMSELASQLEDIHVGKRISCRTWHDLRVKALYLSSIGYGVAVNGFKDMSDNVLTITALPEENMTNEGVKK